MPEGDSIHKLAAQLRPLVGKTVRAFESRTIGADLVGRTVVSVEALGKNLLVLFDDGRALQIHLRMLGRVYVHARAEDAWPFPSTPQVLLAVDGCAFAGSRIPVLRLLRAGGVKRAPDLASLGPDLLGATFDAGEAIARLRRAPEEEIGVAIMAQRNVAGIGNVYKSEILFLERVDPRATIAELDDAKLRAILDRARALMQRNVRARGPRVTRSAIAGPRVWVYDRRGRGCFVCKSAIVAFRQGAAPGRTTFACPTCQRLSRPRAS